MNKLILIAAGASVAVAQYPRRSVGGYGFPVGAYGFPGQIMGAPIIQAAPRPQMVQAAPRVQQFAPQQRPQQVAPQQRAVQRPQQFAPQQRPQQFAPQQPQQRAVQRAVQEAMPEDEPYLVLSEIIEYDFENRLDDKLDNNLGKVGRKYINYDGLDDPNIYLLNVFNDNSDSEDIKFDKALDYALITNGFGKGIGWGGEVDQDAIFSDAADGNAKDYFYDKFLGNDPTDDFAGDVLGDIEEDLLFSGFEGDKFTKYLIKEKLLEPSSSDSDDDTLTKYLKYTMLAGGVDPLTFFTILEDDDSSEDRKDKFLKYAMLGGGNELFSNPLLLWSMLSDESTSQDDDELMKYLLVTQPVLN